MSTDRVHTPAVTVTGLTKHFGRVIALDDLDLEIEAGEILGVLGPNGAGKTTLIRLLLGMLRPTAGRATIFGLDAIHDAARAHHRLAYVPGETSLWPELTGGQTLTLLGRLHGYVDEKYRDELLARFELDARKRVRDYSKGNRQKVALVAALMTRADLLVLDEPTSGLDPLMEREFVRAVREATARGQTVLLSSHVLSEVEELCDRVALLRAGKLLDLGSLSQLRHLSAVEVSVTFDGPVPELPRIPGVADVVVSGSTQHCSVRGPMEPLLRALGEHRVSRLLSHEPSLEELFLAHYGDHDGGKDGSHDGAGRTGHDA